LEGVEYRPEFETAPDKWIEVIRYDKAEKIIYTIYNYKNPKRGDTIKIDWRPNGTIRTIKIYAIDSINYPFLYESFHENGILAEKGIYDEYHSPIVRTGLWRYYDSTGILSKTENYIYPEKKRPYKIITEYYNNGKPKSAKMYINHAAITYESDEEEATGTWKYYDENGKIVKTEKYENGKLVQKTLQRKYAGLSKQFNIELTVERYIDTACRNDYYSDSLIVRLQIKDKLTGKLLDRITVTPKPPFSYFYYDEDDCSDVTSYSTGFNTDRKIYDNYFGCVVVADLNFDGRDDIALVYDSAVDAGPYCVFFIQNDNCKFIKDYFLTDEMEYFPHEIDRLRRQLTTYAPVNAVSGCKCVYRLDSITNKWNCINKKYY
jgi:antitoxin component YwqK of YwqJK toxin-antitoxin module